MYLRAIAARGKYNLNRGKGAACRVSDFLTMNFHSFSRQLGLGIALIAGLAKAVAAGDGPTVTGVQVDPTAHRATLTFDPAPATTQYQILRAPRLDQPFVVDPTGALDGFVWTGTGLAEDTGFFRVQAVEIPPNQLTETTLLQRVAYGPSPDDLERVRALGPDGYLAEQLAAESIPDTLDTSAPGQVWRKVTVSGPGSAPKLYIYFDGSGETYLDEIRLVEGAVDDPAKPNLIVNGGFENSLGTNWIVSANLAASALTPDQFHDGSLALHVVSTAAGSSETTSIHQNLPATVVATKTYTLTFWYQTQPGQSAHLTVRLSGSGIASTVSLASGADSPQPLFAKLSDGSAAFNDLRRWHILRAIQSRRQLNEVLRQFCENHFVTQYSKTRDYFDNLAYDTTTAGTIATQAEFHENLKWSQALLKPDVTFLDLLRISAESPAMIVYLDTVGSKGNGSNIANENYARELCELFTFGVDNGYDQQDIVQISRLWTGWTIDLVSSNNVANPFASRSTNYLDPTVVTNKTALTNLLGTWSFVYKSGNHNTGAKKVFFIHDAAGAATTPKLVPDRFGTPWAKRDYSISFPAATGTNTIQEAYTLIQHMANQPFTEEFLSVKLCRLFVHDDFQIGYDFTDADTSPEEELVHACMLAWETPANGGPKGQIREVLKVIFNSELFRSHTASQQKVRTPLEFVAATMRALRATRPDGSSTAYTDGDLAFALSRMGLMLLFDRAEPNGYSETAEAWISAGTLAERLRFVQGALMPAGMTGKGDGGANTAIDPVGLLQLKAPAAVRNSGLAADYFLDLLFPAEGKANLTSYRAMAVTFLDTADDGVTASPFSALNPASTDYDNRLRGMVAALMTTQRYQEQ